MKLLVLPLCLLLAGCGSLLVRRPAVPAQVDPLCFQPVKDNVRWTGNPDDPAAWDALAGDVVPTLRSKIGEAEVHRKACEQALRRLDKAKVIDLGR